MLTLFTHPMSPCAQKVRICLTEKNLEWNAVHIDLPNKQNLRPDYLKLNPAGVVPTLVDDETVVTESSIICEYLDDKYTQTRLTPLLAADRAEMRLWMKLVDNQLHPSCGAIQWPMVMRDNLLALSEKERVATIDRVPDKARRERQRRLLEMGLDAPDVASAVATYCATIQKMEVQLEEREWILGDSFSLADACLAPYFQTLYQFSWMALLDNAPNVRRWYQACRKRDSYVTGVSDDFDEKTLSELMNRGRLAWDKLARHL